MTKLESLSLDTVGPNVCASDTVLYFPTWHDTTGNRHRLLQGSLIRLRSAPFVDTFPNDLRIEAVLRTIEPLANRYVTAGPMSTIESPFLELWTFVVRIEGNPTTEACSSPFECLLAQCFRHTAFVCDDAIEYVIPDVRGDEVGERLAFIIGLAMHAEVTPDVRIEVVSDPPVAPSTAPRCIGCGRQFDDRDVRALNGLLGRPFRFAITCPEHDPIFASMRTEVTHAH